MRSIFFILPFLICSLWGKEITVAERNGEFSLSLSIPQTQFDLLDEIPFTITLTYPSNYHIDINKIRSRLLYHSFSVESPFSLISQKDFPKEQSNHSTTQKIIFTLDPQYSGTQYLTLLDVLFEPNDPNQSKPIEIISPILELTIVESGKKVEQPLIEPLMIFSKEFPIDLNTDNRWYIRRDLSSLERINRLFREKNIPWVGLLALAAGLIFIFTFKKPPQPEKNRAKEDAIIKETSRKNLTKLDTLIQEGQGHEFYFELTSTVRKFLEDYYHLHAESRTTEEFLNDRLVQSIFTKATQNKLKAFLEQADKIKYAKAQASKEDCRKALETALSLIPP